MLTHRYARAVDLYNADELLEVFTHDAVLDHSAFGLARSVGHAEIGAYFAKSRASGRQSMHLLTNHIVEIEGADTASGTHYVQAFRPGPDGGQPLVAALAINNDEYTRTESGWRIGHRVTTTAVDISFDF